MASLLKKISECFAVCGFEDEIRNLVLKNIKADEIFTDTMGNVIAHKFGKGKKLLISSHMDESGFIVTDVTDGGYIKFQAAGNIDVNTVISKRVVIGENKIKGVIGMKAIHLQTKDERENTVPVKKLFIDIGEKDKKSALKKINIGDYIMFDTEFFETDDILRGKALSRIGIYTLIKSIKNKYDLDLYYSFTTQKEIGMRGADIISRRIEPDYVINIDTVQADDVFNVKEKSTELGKGACVIIADKYSISDRELADFAVRLADKCKIRHSKIAAKQSLSDSGALQTGANGAKTLTLAIPCRYANTPVELVDRNDLTAVGELLDKILKSNYFNK